MTTSFTISVKFKGPGKTFVMFEIGFPTSKLDEFPNIQSKPNERSLPAGSRSRRKY